MMGYVMLCDECGKQVQENIVTKGYAAPEEKWNFSILIALKNAETRELAGVLCERCMQKIIMAHLARRRLDMLVEES